MSEEKSNQKQRERLSAQATRGMPKRLFAVTTPLGERVLVKRGDLGHYAVPADVSWQLISNGQTKEETDAAVAGSMFGWHVPAARMAMPAPELKPVTFQDPVELRAALVRAEAAHAAYEKTLGHRDEDWARWYAVSIFTSESGT
jgi:hypothetical protein